MRTKFLIVAYSIVFSFYSTGILAQEDDCHIDLDDAGITAKLTDTSDMGGKTQISIMFSNASENNYEVPVVRIGSCEFIKSEVLFPEMGKIKAGETITQSYLCGSGFRSDSVAIKMYLKAPSDETATSACTTISLAPLQTSPRGSLPGNNDPNKTFAVVSSCDYRTETCGVTINGKEDYIPYSDLSKVIPMYSGSRKEPVYCDGPICYRAFLDSNAIGLNPEFSWADVSLSEQEQTVQQDSEPPVDVKALVTSNANLAGQQLYKVVITSLVPEIEVNHVLINRNEKCNDNDYIEKSLSGRVRTKFKMGEKKTVTTVCDPVEVFVKTSQGDFTAKFR